MTQAEREQRRIENYNLANEFFMNDKEEDEDDNEDDDGPSMQ